MSKAAKINGQQIPKVEAVMDKFVAPPGYVLMDTDFASLEPKVVAYFSRDPEHLKLYASGLPHDVYLYVAMALFDDKRDAIAAVYKPDAPTKASVAAAKAQFKHERRVAKELHLAAGYGAGAPRMYGSMRVKGVRVTLDEVTDMRTKYWQLFAGVKDWERALLREREDRGGWIYNGRGRPLAIADDKVRDIINTFAQSTGHDCLVTLLLHINRLRKQRGVAMRPWIVDYHDETIWAVREDHAELARQVFVDAYKLLNDELGGDVPLTGNIDTGYSLWPFKAG
jgi:DNA polymerase I-like protein with 3'-5' exonuclease and polymerase domains